MDVSLLIRLIDQVTGPAQKVRGALKQVGEGASELKRGFSQAIREGFAVENIEKSTRNAEAALTRARSRLMGAVAMGMTLFAGVKVAGDFESGMANISTLVDTAKENIGEMGQKVLEIGGRLPVALNDLTSALYDVRSAGIDASDAMSVLENSGRLAVAGLGTTQESVDLVTSSINAFNLKGEQQARLYDIIFKAVKNGKTTISQLAQGFGAVAGTVANANVEIDDYFASVAALTTTGLPAAQAHTQIRAAISGLTRETKESARMFKKLGAENFADLVEKSGGLVGAFERIKEYAKGDDAALLKLLGSVEALNAVLGLAGEQNEKYQQTLDDMRNGANAVDEAFDKQAQDFNKQMAMVGNSLKGLLVPLTSALLPVLKEVIAQVKPIVAAMTDWVKANPELAGSLVKVTAALMALFVASRLLSFGIASVRLPLVGLAGSFLKFDGAGRNVARGWRLLAGAGRLLGGAFGIVRTALFGLLGVLGGLSAPVLAAVAVLAAAGLAIWKYWDSISTFVSGFASVIGDVIGTAIGGVVGLIGDLISGLGRLLGFSPDQMSGFSEALADMFDFSGLIDGAKAALDGFWSLLGGIFSQEKLSDAEKAGMEDAGRRMGEALINGIRTFVETWIEPIQAMFKFDLEIDWPEPPSWLKWIIEKGKGAVDAVSGLNTGAATATTGAPAGAGAEVSWFPSFGNWFSGADEAADKISRGAEAGGDAVAKGGQTAGQALNEGARAIRDAASQLSAAAARAGIIGRPSGSGNVAGAISDAKAGALHEGTD